MNETEAARIAAAAVVLHPGWNAASVKTILLDSKRVTSRRPWQDVASAMAWIATDPQTQTPARIHEPGPWWHIGIPEDIGPDPAIDCARCGNVHPRHLDCVAEGWQRTLAAKADRVHALLEQERAELQAIERCSHKVPRSHCAEHRKQVDA